MTTNALDLAARLEDAFSPKLHLMVHAAAELRRLHALNQELLKALKGIVGWFDDDSRDGADKHIKKAHAAIAKAEGTKP